MSELDPSKDVARDQNPDDSDEHEVTERESLDWSSTRRMAFGSLLAVLALVAAALLGGWYASPRYPADDSVDAGFARDMSAHHAQAIDMSMTIRSKSTSADIATLAYDVVTTQENQRGQMSGWLQMWGLSQANHGQAMDWMRATGHQHAGLAKGQMLLPDGRMPGMASKEELAKLAKLTGKNAEILYLQLMIRHHKSGVEMAKAARANASQPQVVRLAETMVAGQQSEITLMTQMLADRGATPA